MDRYKTKFEQQARVEHSEIGEAVVSVAAEEIDLRKPPKDLCLARQPIFDTSTVVYAYELLHSPLNPNSAPAIDANASSSQVLINAFLDIDIEDVSNNLPSFISVSRDFLVGRLPMPFPPQSLVLQIPASMEVDIALLQGLRYFKEEGFKLALEGYRFEQGSFQLAGLVDFVKIDITGYTPQALKEGVAKLAGKDFTLIAQQVETREAFEQCHDAGFKFFQGSFISKPLVMKGNVLKPNRLAVLKMLKLLEDPDSSISVLEELISQDVTLSFKILRIINSAYYGFRRKIESVKQAVVALGLKVIRNWFILISLTDIDDKPQELMQLTLLRARMMQSLTNAMGLNKDTGFTIGLFSSIDAIMDQPMREILEKLPFSEEISEALLHREGVFGQMLNIVLHYEQGDWAFIKNSGFEMSELSTFYFEAMYWSRGLIEQIKAN